MIAILEEAIAERRVSQVAKDWGIPRWVIDDVRQGKTGIPSARYLPAIARGIGITVDELLDRANGAPQEVPG